MRLVWQGEKSTNFFLNLEKNCGNQNQIRTLISDEKEIDDNVEISNKIESSSETLFKSQLCEIANFVKM